jgi:hypothetical protein
MGWEYPKNRSMVDTYVKREILPTPFQQLASGSVWLVKDIISVKLQRDSR